MASQQKRVAVILAGCGVYDGSEAFETMFTLLNLSKQGADIMCFAPDMAQMHVVNHLTGQPEEGATRNVLVESARLAHGQIKPLTELRAADFDACIFPGGFGAAKNLGDFAVKGAEYTVIPEVERVVREFHGAQKVMGFECVAPTIAAKVIGDGVEVSFGSDQTSEEYPNAGACGAAEGNGATHVVTDPETAHYDAKHKVVTTCCFMRNVPLNDVASMEKGVAALVAKVMEQA